MADVQVVTTEELSELRAFRDQSDKYVINLGEIRYQKILLDNQESQITKDLLHMKTLEQQMISKLVDKYGDVVIDVETGIISKS